MKNISSLILLLVVSSCTTIHFRSKNSIPVTFEGNPKHQREVSVEGKRDFYFWGLEPEETEVFVDEEVYNAGYTGMSKVIIYEQKNPQNILISFLTFGLYLPRAYTITGFVSNTIEDVEETAEPKKSK